MALLDAHGPAVVGMLRRLCPGRHDAEDVFQETAARVWRHLPAGAGGSNSLRNPRAWVMTVAYRAFVDARWRRRSEGFDAGAADVDPVDARAGSPARAAERSETFDRVQAAVAELPA